MCREVTIKPNTKWGGDGSLGCGIGYGYLHRIPVRELPPESKPLFRMPINTVASPVVPQPTPIMAAAAPCTPVPIAPATDPTIAYVPPLLNTFPAVSSGTDVSVDPATMQSAPGIYGVPPMPATTILSSTTTSVQENSSGIFGVPPMPPTSIFNPSAIPQQQTHEEVRPQQVPTSLPPPIWSLPSSVPIPAATVAPPITVPTQTQEALAAAFQPTTTPMTYGGYGQAFTQATVPVPMSAPAPLPQQFTAPVPTIQQIPMSIPTYASCPQAVVTPGYGQQTTTTATGLPQPPPPMMASNYFTGPPSSAPGATMNTNISLPGMPPLTVSATIPPGLQFGPQ